MNMHHIISTRHVLPGQEDESQEKELDDSNKVRNPSLLVYFPLLDSVDANAVEHFKLWGALSTERNNIHAVPSVRQSRCVLQYSRVALVKRIREHANLH